jgi:hypothetical protein
LTLATPPTATHTKSVGVGDTNAYMNIRQRIDALLKGVSCCNTWSGWGQFSFLKENQKLSSQQINQQQCLET